MEDAGLSGRQMQQCRHKTLQGGTIQVSGSGQDFNVNGNSSVVCGNIQTANATVYLIDQVLLPKS